MKNGKLSALLNTPMGTVVTVAAVVLGAELLFMMFIEEFIAIQFKLSSAALDVIDAVTLTAILSLVLYFLVFRPMRKQQAELEDARKKAESAFQEWMAALDAVNDPIFLHDKDLRILRCNKAYQQCAGLPFHEIIGQPYYEIFPKDHAPLPSCQRAMEKAAEEELAIGGAIYRSRAFSIKDEQGVYLYSVHTLEDITERKQAEDALRVSTLKYQLLFDSSRDALMMIAPPSWKFTGANQATLRLFGASSVAEFAALGPWDVSPEQQPDGRTSSEKAQEMIATAMREGSHFFEWEHQRLDGQPFAADVLLTRMEVGGEIIVQATVRDITERKQAEQALHESEKLYRSLFENMLNGFAYCQMIFEQDRPQDFIYLSVNAAFETLTGLKNVVGKRVSEVIPGIRQSDPKLFEMYGRVSLSGKPEQFEIYLESLQQWFWISVYSPEKGYFVAVFDVITERKRAEAALSEQLKELRGWHDITLGREMRVLELKHEVDELLAQAGQPPRYHSAESDDQQEK